MMISTKGRYALRFLADVAEHQGDGFVPLKDVAVRQEISEKYLEIVVKELVKGGLLTALRGKGGGYRLTCAPDSYRVGDILRLTEGDLAPVACLSCNADACEHSETCKTLPMWSEFYKLTNTYFDGITLSDIME